mgnify:CR=1 FL=1
MKRFLLLITFLFFSVISISQESFSRPCELKPFSAFVIDSNEFSSIRATPLGEIILTISNLHSDGFVVHVIDFEDGWFKIDAIIGVSSFEVSSLNGWIHHSLVYALNTYDLEVMESPNQKKQVGIIKGEIGDPFNILDVQCEWIKIQYKSLVGWVKSEEICGNPVTTCP